MPHFATNLGHFYNPFYHYTIEFNVRCVTGFSDKPEEQNPMPHTLLKAESRAYEDDFRGYIHLQGSRR